MKAFILSAGFGKRLHSVTGETPKVMVKIGGKPVLEHLVNLCKIHGITSIIINLHYVPQAVVNYFGDGRKFGVSIAYSFEKEKIMGGAGALKHAEKLIGNGTFIVLNGDVMTNANLSKMITFHKQKGGLGTFLVHDTDHHHDSDLVEFDENKLINKFFRAAPGYTKKPISKTGIHIFESEILKFIPPKVEYSIEHDLIPDLLIRNKKLYAFYDNDAYSRDMGTPKRLRQVINDYESGKINF